VINLTGPTPKRGGQWPEHVPSDRARRRGEHAAISVLPARMVKRVDMVGLDTNLPVRCRPCCRTGVRAPVAKRPRRASQLAAYPETDTTSFVSSRYPNRRAASGGIAVLRRELPLPHQVGQERCISPSQRYPPSIAAAARSNPPARSRLKPMRPEARLRRTQPWLPAAPRASARWHAARTNTRVMPRPIRGPWHGRVPQDLHDRQLGIVTSFAGGHGRPG